MVTIKNQIKIRNIISENSMGVFFAVVFIFSAIFVKGFFTTYNILNYLLNTATLFVVACGVTFVVLNGGIDFSATAVVTMGSVFGAYIMVKSPFGGTFLGLIIGVLTIIMIGIIFGIINGFSVIVLKMPSFIATLAIMMVGNGISVWFASVAYDKASLTGLPEEFLILGGRGNHLYIPILITIAILIFSHWLLKYTLFGRQIYSIGTNPKASFISGIPVKKTVFILFILSGLYAAFASILYTAKNGAGIPTLGDKIFIDIAAAIVLGGTSIAGGRGGAKQTLYGALFVMLIDNVMNLMGITWYVITLVKGILILIATTIEILNRANIKVGVKKESGIKVSERTAK
jgi:ribose/xylose/arabinose/galactoside ABC-type transport system permease subunit